MPWLAAHPGGHAHWAPPGSAHEAWLRAEGYVETAPPSTKPATRADQATPGGEGDQVDEPVEAAPNRPTRRVTGEAPQ